jgi:acyl-CoA thioesterase
MNVPAGDFLTDSTCTPDPEHPHLFHGDISPAWQIVDAFGGMSMSVALRAMQDALGRPDLRLLSATSCFVDRVPCGPVSVEVEVLRVGTRIAQVASKLRAGGSDGVSIASHAVFGVAHDFDARHQEVEFPADVRAPEDCDPPPPPPVDAPWGHINFHDQNDWRPATGTPMWDPSFRAGRGRMASWTRLHKTPRLADGTIDPIVLALFGDQIGTAVGQALGPRGHYFTLSLEIGIHFVRPPATDWVLQDAEAWYVGDGYATGPTRLWDAERNLCAIATQTANLRPQ